MEFTQGFRLNYLAGNTDRLEMGLSMIYFNKRPLLPHCGISEMLSFPLDLVHGLDRYNGMVSHMRATNQRTNIHSFFLFCYIIHMWLASIDLGIGWPCFLEGSVFRINPDGSIVSLPPWFSKKSPCASRSAHISDHFCSLKITISICSIFFCDFSFVTECIWYQPIKWCYKNQSLKDCPKQIGLNPAISPQFASRNRKFIVANCNFSGLSRISYCWSNSCKRSYI